MTTCTEYGIEIWLFYVFLLIKLNISFFIVFADVGTTDKLGGEEADEAVLAHMVVTSPWSLPTLHKSERKKNKQMLNIIWIYLKWILSYSAYQCVHKPWSENIIIKSCAQLTCFERPSSIKGARTMPTQYAHTT